MIATGLCNRLSLTCVRVFLGILNDKRLLIFMLRSKSQVGCEV